MEPFNVNILLICSIQQPIYSNTRGSVLKNISIFSLLIGYLHIKILMVQRIRNLCLKGQIRKGDLLGNEFVLHIHTIKIIQGLNITYQFLKNLLDTLDLWPYVGVEIRREMQTMM